jgi:hypothetical protein
LRSYKENKLTAFFVQGRIISKGLSDGNSDIA